MELTDTNWSIGLFYLAIQLFTWELSQCDGMQEAKTRNLSLKKWLSFVLMDFATAHFNVWQLVLGNVKSTFQAKTTEANPSVDFGCVYSDEEIPVPIPNTEVKLVSGNGTALLSVGE